MMSRVKKVNIARARTKAMFDLIDPPNMSKEQFTE